MSASPPLLTPLEVEPGSQTAIVFIHGFQGDPGKTWGEFPRYVKGDDGQLAGWDVYSLGYATSLSLDIRGIWSADPELAILAQLLRSAAKLSDLGRYKRLALVAHSMGGLVLQRALVDDPDLALRAGHVFLFGTPSAGLRNASFVWFWKRSVRDMGANSDFIKDLRARWTNAFAAPPFQFWAVAGASDEFVPWTSSIAPFPEGQRAVIPGDHLQIVKPQDAQHLGVQLVRKGLIGDAAPAGPWNAARVAVQQREFREAIDLLWPNRDKIDDDALVQLALALEEVGRREDAIDVLMARPSLSTDALGVLAGRLKRRWLAERQVMDAARALDLYSEGFKRSETAGNHEQAFYHGINVAFMQAAFLRDLEEARATAERVLDHTAQVDSQDRWKLASEGEAYLILGDTRTALDSYRRAVAAGPSPRELSSMYQQASVLADRLGDTMLPETLKIIFRGEIE